MKVQKTIGELFEEISELKELRDKEARFLANCLSSSRKSHAKTFLDDYKHYDKLIKYYSNIKVEFDDKYESKP